METHPPKLPAGHDASHRRKATLGPQKQRPSEHDAPTASATSTGTQGQVNRAVWSQDDCLLVIGAEGSDRLAIVRAVVAGRRLRRATSKGDVRLIHCDGIKSLRGMTDSVSASPTPARHKRMPPLTDGTLVLSHVSSLSIEDQEELLWAINRDVSPPGALRVAATDDENLVDLVKAGWFSRALYERLASPSTIRLAPLHERTSEIPMLARHILRDLSCSDQLEHDALALLQATRWTDDVRQLRSVIRDAAGAPGRRLATASLASALRSRGLLAASAETDGSPSFAAATDELRRRLLEAAVEEANGNLTQAGIRLGLHLRRDETSEQIDLRSRKLAYRKVRYWRDRLRASMPPSSGSSSSSA